MPKRQLQKSVNLDTVAKGKLPEHVLNSIGELQVKIKEVEGWAEGIPTIDVGIKDQTVRIHINLDVPLRRAVGVVGASIAALLTVLVFLIKYEPIINYIVTRLGL